MFDPKVFQPLPTNVNYDGYTIEQGLASVGEGWASLIKLAFEKLPEGIKIVQVKEKYGGLRIYTDYGGNNAFTALIHDLERRSVTICEVCGKPAKIDTSRYWLKTLCEEHITLRKK